MTVITGKNKLDPTRCCQIKLLKENGNTNEKYLTHESKRQHGLRRQTQLKMRGCVPAYGTIKLMTWQMLCDLKPRLSATNVIQLSIGWLRDVPCLLSGPVFDFSRRGRLSHVRLDASFGPWKYTHCRIKQRPTVQPNAGRGQFYPWITGKAK